MKLLIVPEFVSSNGRFQPRSAVMPPPDLPCPIHAPRSLARHPATAFAAPSPHPTARASTRRVLRRSSRSTAWRLALTCEAMPFGSASCGVAEKSMRFSLLKTRRTHRNGLGRNRRSGSLLIRIDTNADDYKIGHLFFSILGPDPFQNCGGFQRSLNGNGPRTPSNNYSIAKAATWT
jgi:hypothetical protein